MDKNASTGQKHDAWGALRALTTISAQGEEKFAHPSERKIFLEQDFLLHLFGDAPATDRIKSISSGLAKIFKRSLAATLFSSLSRKFRTVSSFMRHYYTPYKVTLPKRSTPILFDGQEKCRLLHYFRINMKCLVCRQENDSSLIFCRKCKSVLPQLFDGNGPTSAVDAVVGDGGIKVRPPTPSPTNCRLYKGLLQAASQLVLGLISEDEFHEMLDDLSTELSRLDEGISSFSPGELEHFREEVSLFEASERKFREAFHIIRAYPDDFDEEILKEATDLALLASELLCRAVNRMGEALERTETNGGSM